MKKDKNEVTIVELEEALQVMEEIYQLAINRMKHGAKVHGKEMVRSPFKELEEEIADGFNYIVLGYIKILKACGGYKDKWDLHKLPDVQSRRLNETKR